MLSLKPMFVVKRYSLRWQEEGATTTQEKTLENVTCFNFNNLVSWYAPLSLPPVENSPPPGQPCDIFDV